MRIFLTRVKAFSSSEPVEYRDSCAPFRAHTLGPEFFDGTRFGMKSIQENMLTKLFGKEEIGYFGSLDHSKNMSFIMGMSNIYFDATYPTKTVPSKSVITSKVTSSFSPSILLGQFSNRLHCFGPGFIDNSACASTGASLLLAKMLIEQGESDRVIVSIVDNPFSPTTINTFTNFHICATLSDGNLPSAFDSKNIGFDMGQGCGYMFLESEKSLEETGNEPLFELLSSHSIMEQCANPLSQDENGKGYELVIQGALAKAKLQPNDIQLVKTHGSGTTTNNVSEGSAIRRIFDKDYSKAIAYKQWIGHTFAASGVCELDLLMNDIGSGSIRKINNRTEEDDFFISEDLCLSNFHDVKNILFLASGLSNIFNGFVLRKVK